MNKTSETDWARSEILGQIAENIAGEVELSDLSLLALVEQIPESDPREARDF